MKISQSPNFLPKLWKRPSQAPSMDTFLHSKATRLVAYPALGAVAAGLVARGITSGAGSSLTRVAGITGTAAAGALLGGAIGGFLGVKLASSSDGFGSIAAGAAGAGVGAVVGAVGGGIAGLYVPASSAMAVAIGGAALSGAAGGFLWAVPR